MTAVDEVNRDKTKILDSIFFRTVSLVCFTAELDELGELIHKQCTCKLIIKTLRLHTCMQTNSCVFVFMF